MKTLPLLMTALVLGTPCAVSAQRAAMNAQPTPATVQGTANVHLMSFSEALKQISREYKVTLLADAYAGEDAAVMPVSEWQGRPLAEAIGRIAKLRERDVIVIGGIYVLRHKRWAMILARTAHADYPQQWPDDGTLTITRLDKPDADGPALPAHDVQIAAGGVSCSRFVSELAKAAAYDVRVVPEIGAQRLSLYAQDAAPASILGGLAFLLNAGPEVVLRPSKSQTAMQSDAESLLPDFLKKRVKPSQALRADLEKGLTDEQRQALAGGQYVPLSVGSLPADLQGRALDYIKLAASLNSDLIPPPDLSRQNSFQVRFYPAQSGSMSWMLGVVTMDADGSEYYF